MRRHLIWKLLWINLLVIAFVLIIVWFSIDYLAADYFVTLMEKYHISPEPAHEMFVSAVHRYLVWACASAAVLTIFLSYYMMKRVLAPLSKMNEITSDIAAGDFTARVPVVNKDEVGQLAVAFNQMAESLEKIEDLRKTMMIDVAHELRTPLTNILGYLEALVDEVVPPTKQTYTLLHDETLRLAQLVEDILQLAKADAARSNLKIQTLELSEQIQAAFTPFKAKFEDKGIQIQFHGLRKVCRIAADKEKLNQILRNLIDNAIRYTPQGGCLEVSTELYDTQIRISFTNTGGEINTEDLPFVFERFYRGEKSRSREHGGAGIGLAVVKELVEAHGGSVGATLPSNQTRIWFSLPVVKI